MCEMVLLNSEPATTREATECMVKILDSTYANADLKQVANITTELNNE